MALPGFAWVRRGREQKGAEEEGTVSTSEIQSFDLVIAAGYLILFLMVWKTLPETLARTADADPTVGGVVVQMIGMIFLAGVVPAILFWRVNLKEFFGLEWQAWKKVFWIAPAFVFSMLVLLSLQIALGWQDWTEWKFGAEQQAAVTLLKESKDVGLLLALAVSAVLIAPLTEEVIFRGYLYPVMKRYSNRWVAAVFTGVAFGVIHFNVFSLPTLAVMGVVLVVLYEKTGSLWVTIACHAAFNGLTVGAHLIPKLVEAGSSS